MGYDRLEIQRLIEAGEQRIISLIQEAYRLDDRASASPAPERSKLKGRAAILRRMAMEEERKLQLLNDHEAAGA